MVATITSTFSTQESVLILRARVAVHSGVVRKHLYVIDTQRLCQLLHSPPRKAVDDAAFAGIVLDEVYYFLIHPLRLLTHLIIKVGAVERKLEHLGVQHIEIPLDVIAAPWGWPWP